MGEGLEKEQIHKGLVGVVVDETNICSVDGIKGTLYYRGYDIHDLVENSSFEEVIYLLLFGILPSQFELDSFKEQVIRERNIPDNILTILKSFPRNTTRIELLRTAISALSLYDKENYDYSEAANLRKGIRIIAKIPTILAFSHRIQSNLPLVEPEMNGLLSHAANFYYMLTGKKLDRKNPKEKQIEDAFDKILICHAEHDLNASTFSARVTVSTLSDIYSAITSAIGTLRGSLHGGANEKVIYYLLDEIKRKENIIPWVEAKLKNKEKIMGFGHRVYKRWDPRALILREYSKEFCALKFDNSDNESDIDNLFEITEILKDYMIENKGIYPNMDLYSASLLYSLGVPPPLYTPFFAVSRCVGWIAHSIEQLQNNMLIRPRLRYNGDINKEFKHIKGRRRPRSNFFF
ncbi:MAG: citrate/2-methylcitrate synthase [Promethearchaeota archaeon]